MERDVAVKFALNFAMAVALAFAANATPSANNFHAVTNDWYQGNYSNVYELAQQRLVANSNDLVAAVNMESYDLRFSSFAAISNSILRLMRASEAAAFSIGLSIIAIDSGCVTIMQAAPTPSSTETMAAPPRNGDGRLICLRPYAFSPLRGSAP